MTFQETGSAEWNGGFFFCLMGSVMRMAETIAYRTEMCQALDFTEIPSLLTYQGLGQGLLGEERDKI